MRLVGANRDSPLHCLSAIKMNQLKRLFLFFISAIALILWLQQPTIVLATDNRAIQTIEQEAQQLYQQNQYPEAIALIKTAIKQYQKHDDRVGMAIATRNLALIYQKLGAWEQAETTLARGTKIIDSIDSEPEKSQLLAQILEVKGQVELSLGRSQNALATWRKATSVYEKQGNITGLTQGKIYQAHALQALGLYSQSLTTLTATNQQLENQPDSLIKAQALLNLGNVLNRVGKYQAANDNLKSALATAKKLEDKPTMADILLSLGNNARFQEQPEVAINFYQQAIATDPEPDIQLRGKLDELGVLVGLENQKAASNLAIEIERLITQLPPRQTTIQAQISLARHLIQLDIQPRQVAKLLADAVKQSKSLNIPRTEADALGVLGNLYERHHQWQSAAQITERALVKAQSLDAKELSYQWQWQLGRILKAQGNRERAIASYTQATENLQSL